MPCPPVFLGGCLSTAYVRQRSSTGPTTHGGKKTPVLLTAWGSLCDTPEIQRPQTAPRITTDYELGVCLIGRKRTKKNATKKHRPLANPLTMTNLAGMGKRPCFTGRCWPRSPVTINLSRSRRTPRAEKQKQRSNAKRKHLSARVDWRSYLLLKEGAAAGEARKWCANSPEESAIQRSQINSRQRNRRERNRRDGARRES